MNGRKSSTRHRASRLFFLGAALAACNSPEYGGMTFDQRTVPPLAVTVESDYIAFPVGVAFLVKALPVSANEDPYTARDDMALTSANERILGVYEADRITRVVLVGVSEGRSCLRVEINGREEDCILVEILPNDGSISFEDTASEPFE